MYLTDVMNNARASFERIARDRELTSAEEKKTLRVGTADLLDMLLSDLEPGVDELELTLALGADTFMNLTEWTWLRSEDVFRLLGGRIIIFVRKEEEMLTEEKLKERIEEIKQKFAEDRDVDGENIRLLCVPTLTEVSSSAVRKSTETSGLVPGVAAYMEEHKLYAFSQDLV